MFSALPSISLIAAGCAFASGLLLGVFVASRNARAREQERARRNAEFARFHEDAMNKLRNAYSMTRAKGMEQRLALAHALVLIEELKKQLVKANADLPDFEVTSVDSDNREDLFTASGAMSD